MNQYTRFEERPEGDRFRVFNVETQSFTRGHFVTYEAAHEWVLSQTVKHLFAPSSMPGRASAHRLPPNFNPWANPWHNPRP